MKIVDFPIASGTILEIQSRGVTRFEIVQGVFNNRRVAPDRRHIPRSNDRRIASAVPYWSTRVIETVMIGKMADGLPISMLSETRHYSGYRISNIADIMPATDDNEIRKPIDIADLPQIFDFRPASINLNSITTPNSLVQY